MSKKSICNIISSYKNNNLKLIFNVTISSYAYVHYNKKIKYKPIIKHINFNSEGSVKKRLVLKNPKIIIYNVNKQKYSNNRKTNDNYLLKNLKKNFNKDISLVDGTYDKDINRDINHDILFHDSDENINKFLVTFYKSTNVSDYLYIEYWLSISYHIFKENFTYFNKNINKKYYINKF